MTADRHSGFPRPAIPSAVTAAWLSLGETGPHSACDAGPESGGEKLPTFETPVRPLPARAPAEALALLQPGGRLGDFELVRVLGAGSFGRVFLARQLSLGRLVALKVTTGYSGEARTLAGLEHEHIVRVFAEGVDGPTGLRLLAMHYVRGATLERVMQTLRGFDLDARTGKAIRGAVRALAGPRSPTAGRGGEALAHCDAVEAVCWLGARLADALDHAHRRGVLHRDVKPSNILLGLDGRPLLADFNLAAGPRRGGEPAFGGTLGYMAPEHLDAFNPNDPTPPRAVDARSDIYSLGVVLFELLTGRRPFGPAAAGFPPGEALRALAAARRQGAPAPRQLRPDIPAVLDRVVRRCLDPNPDRRYPTAEELARVLDGCGELRRLGRDMPPAGPITRAARARPQFVGLLLPLLPHLLGALVVFGYTAAWVASHPARAVLEGLYARLALGYSLVVFPLTGGISFTLTRPIWRACVRLQGPAAADAAAVDRVRRRALCKPLWGAVLSGLGWLPGAVLLPALVLCLAPAAAGWDVVLHYSLSFLIAGLIALTYTEFADQYLLLCVAYPALWADPVHPRQTARDELGPVDRRLRIFQVQSGLVPLATGIALMAGLAGAGPEQRTAAGYQTFLLLVTTLMGLGLAGSWLAVLISGRLGRAATALTGAVGGATAL
jgi:serine/threonine protein kinase